MIPALAMSSEAAAKPADMIGEGMAFAQAEVRIPSDTQLERMEERAITTPPLDINQAPARDSGEEAEIRLMDERARRIDERLMGSGAICTDCK
jgi:hypothetical protein